MALALDGSAKGNSGSSSAFSLSLTTANTNDLICMVSLTSDVVNSVTAAGLTFTLAPGFPNGASGNILTLFTAPSSGTLSALSITANIASSAFITMAVFGISGANTSSSFDASAIKTTNASASPLSLNTTAANTFILGIFDDNAGAGSGFTDIGAPGNFLCAEYQIVSSPQSGLAVVTSAPNTADAMAIAIVQASAGGFHSRYYYDLSGVRNV